MVLASLAVELSAGCGVRTAVCGARLRRVREGQHADAAPILDRGTFGGVRVLVFLCTFDSVVDVAVPTGQAHVVAKWRDASGVLLRAGLFVFGALLGRRHVADARERETSFGGVPADVVHRVFRRANPLLRTNSSGRLRGHVLCAAAGAGATIGDAGDGAGTGAIARAENATAAAFSFQHAAFDFHAGAHQC